MGTVFYYVQLTEILSSKNFIRKDVQFPQRGNFASLLPSLVVPLAQHHAHLVEEAFLNKTLRK